MSFLSWRRVIGLVLLVSLLIAAWFGWTAWQLQRDLTAAQADVDRLQGALTASNDQEADLALAALQEHSSSASDRASGATWQLLTHVPRVGDDVAGVATVSEVLDDLSVDAMPPLVEASRQLDGLVPREGRIDTAAISPLADPVARGADGFARAQAELERHDPSGYVTALRSRYRDLTEEVASFAQGLDSAEEAIEILPGMLGADRQRTYLMVFQNNAEVRTTGGIPGAASLVTADRGLVSLHSTVNQQSLGQAPVPVLPLTPSERKLYGPELGIFFADANWVPYFGRTAELWKARWEQVYPEVIDGVISLDPVALSYLLEATGPVVVDGVELNSTNVVEQLLHEVYLRFPEDIAAQDRFFANASSAIFTAVTTGIQSPQAFLEGLSRGVDERRIYLWSFQESEKAILAESPVGGGRGTGPGTTPVVGVYLNDLTGSKMSYYLRHSAQVAATSCVDGMQRLTGRVRLKSLAPLDAAELPDYVTGGGQFGTPPGSQLVYVSVYGPTGGTVTDVRLRDKREKVDVVIDDGRPVFRIPVLLEPQTTIDLTFRLDSGPGQTDDVLVDVTPGMEPQEASSESPSACS